MRSAARGFSKIVKRYPKVEVVDTTPGDWDVTKVARIGETLLSKFPKIDPAYFHNDDMALAAYDVMKAHNRTSIKIGGCDATPPALQAVMDGRMVATVRNPSCLIHGCAIIARDVATVSGEKTGMGPGMIPKHIVTDGPVVTKANAPGLAWMEEHFLI